MNITVCGATIHVGICMDRLETNFSTGVVDSESRTIIMQGYMSDNSTELQVDTGPIQVVDGLSVVTGIGLVLHTFDGETELANNLSLVKIRGLLCRMWEYDNFGVSGGQISQCTIPRILAFRFLFYLKLP